MLKQFKYENDPPHGSSNSENTQTECGICLEKLSEGDDMGELGCESNVIYNIFNLCLHKN